ncbi:MAG: MCE family protein [Phycisphaeraceae bacterium]|nr:MCE family protein [Phycisphaeraceae bacterium]
MPTAKVTRRRPISPAWLIPLAALILAAILAFQSWSQRGPRLTLQFEQGHGISANDPVVYRGVRVGRVAEVSIDPAHNRISVDIELSRDASELAWGGRFWIVRPELSLTRIAGLETLIGPRYVAADLPADSNPTVTTVESPPVVRPTLSGPGLSLLLRAPALGSIRGGSPITYREVPVGTVVSIALSDDARTIEIIGRIQPEYAHLVRANTRFWNASGIALDVGLMGGLKLKAESLATVLAGGIAFATPNNPGPVVKSGHAFDVERDPVDDAAKWSPNLAIPSVIPPPEPARP